jgi:hypothetical protein
MKRFTLTFTLTFNLINEPHMLISSLSFVYYQGLKEFALRKYNVLLVPNVIIYSNSAAVFTGLENRDYGHRGSAALTIRHPSIRKNCH